MTSILMILLIFVAIILMGVVLIQSAKGGGLAGTFGGGADASMVFGVRRTADFLIKLTSILGAILLLFSLMTNVMINKSGDTNQSIIQQNTGQQNFPQPNVPSQLNQPGEQQNQIQGNQDQQPQNNLPQDNQQQNNQPSK